MTDCGCDGQWQINYTYNGNNSNSYIFDGKSKDFPVVLDDPQPGCSQPKSIFSSCDGRMLTGLSCNASIGTYSFTFIPGPNCKPGEDGNTYDCLNGQCVTSSKYTTPGIYKSLADCQAVCANGGACGSGKQCVEPTTYCPNGKVCIDQEEYGNIQGLIAKINSEVC